MRIIFINVKLITIKAIVVSFIILIVNVNTLLAHHVLGRPSYSLSEDSNTPPSLQIETQIGKYFVTYMAFPAFPKPNESGRVNLYIRKISNDMPYTGTVTFIVKDDKWFNSRQEIIGTQKSIDNVYRQGFIFKSEGNYIISAVFEADGEPYTIDFPLQIGSPWPIAPLSFLLVSFIIFLVLIKLLIRKKLNRLKTKQHQQEIQA